MLIVYRPRAAANWFLALHVIEMHFETLDDGVVLEPGLHLLAGYGRLFGRLEPPSSLQSASRASSSGQYRLRSRVFRYW
jgi:hypothetical protein